MSGIEVSGNENTVRAMYKCADTAANAIYTVPVGSLGVRAIALTLCNVDGTSAVDATVEVYDKVANTSYRKRYTLAVAADSFADVDFHGLPLLPEDEIRVTASAGGDLECIFVGVEVGGRT